MNIWVMIYRFSWVVFAALMLLVGVCVFKPKWQLQEELIRKKAALAEENRKLEAQKDELVIKEQRFQTDPEFVELTARKEGMVKTNEYVVQFTSNNVPVPVKISTNLPPVRHATTNTAPKVRAPPRGSRHT